MEPAVTIILVAGTMTFANEWYHTKKLNWKVPIATTLLGAGISGLSHIDNTAAIALSLMVLIGAGATKFNGESAFGTLAHVFSARKG